MSESNYSESIIIERLNAGDKEAFNRLFDYYAKKLLNYSISLTHNREDAKEIVQETFLKVWENHEKIRKDLSFNAYIITIAKHLIFNKAKRNILEHAVFEYYRYTSNLFDRNTEDLVEKTDLDEVRLRMIEKLPARRKQILQLRSHGFSNEEVAQKLNISKSTVANQINTAIKDLQNYFKNTITSFLLFF